MKRGFKAVLSIALAAAMIFGMTACGGNSGGGEEEAAASEGGKVLNIWCWNDEFQTRFNDYYPEVAEVAEDGSTTTLKDGTVVNWIIDPNEGNNYLLTIEDYDSIIAEFDYDTLYDKATCNTFSDTVTESYIFSAAIRFGLWFTLGIAAAKHLVAAVHSSTIIHHGQAVMFLGESGTGKSTHTRLWRENIENTSLLNDDSPFIGIVDGKVMVYGSPWSGKTPCYKNESYPLRAIVRLSQAPHNKIRRTKGIAAIGALLPSLPPAFAYDPMLKDCMYEILNKVLITTELYHLEALPNADASDLVYKTLFEQ